MITSIKPNKTTTSNSERNQPMQRFYHPHKRVTFDCGDELITKQSFKAECDINNILRQYSKTGVITHVQNARPTYTDLPDATDYQTSIHTMMAAEAAFADLPASVRSHFDNSPLGLLQALGDPAQAEYLRSVGILNPLEVPPAVPPPVPVPPSTGTT